MKKVFFKAMAVGVLMTALASCSDDLNVDQPKFAQKADLTATFEAAAVNTRLGMLEVEGHNPWAEGKQAGWSWVFTEGDKVRVWSMEAMTYDVYNITGGYDTPTATFELADPAVQKLDEGKEWWAITDAQFAYSLSPNDDGTPVLTYTIPYQYTAKSFEAQNTENADVRRLPAPFWGQAKLDEDKTLDVGLKALTAFLRIEMNELPNDTKYIVLTTHGSAVKDENGDVEEDGFQLLTPDPDDLSKVKTDNGSIDFADNLVFWDANAQKITNGNSEPLTGTFNTTLVDKTSKLGVDEGLEGDDYDMAGIPRLVTRDEMVVKVPEGQDGGVFWIPIIAQHYNNLHVIAVTEKSKYAYKYIGQELKNYNNFEFEVAGRYRLTMNMTQLGKVCAHDLNMAIEKINKANKYNLDALNIVNVDELVNCNHRFDNGDDHDATDRTLGTNPLSSYPNDQILVQGEGDLVLNIAKISATAGAKGNLTSPVLKGVGVLDNTLFVSDKNYGNTNSYKYPDYASAAITTENSVKINMPAKWATDATYGLLADLPKTNAIFAANVDYAPAAQRDAENLRIDVHGSATAFVSGHEAVATTDSYQLKDITDAAITVESGFGQLNVLEQTKGDVYVTGVGSEQKVELTKGLFIYTKEGLSVRMDDALAKQVGFPIMPNHINYLITTGSSATQAVGVADELGKGQIKDGTDKKGNYPNKLNVLAFWTRHALDAEAEGIKDYDVETIYTTAQLASMGEEITNPGEQDKSTSKTYTMSDQLAYVWLGGKDHPWIGPKVTVAEFSFDGNNKGLKNMVMPADMGDAVAEGNTRTIWAYDPHICCTTCGWERTPNGAQTENGKNATPITEFGLIRSINNETSAEIKNVQLNDVYADQDINNIGSLVGEVTKTGNLTLTNNFVGEVRLRGADNVGGLIGNIIKADTVGIDKNTVGSSSYNTGYVRGTNNIGGMIGNLVNAADGVLADDQAVLKIENSKVILAKDIAATGNNAGGVAGNVFAKQADLTTVSVKADEVVAEGENAAGFIAKLIVDGDQSNATITAATVNVNQGIGSDKYAAGLLAYLSAPETNIWGSEIKAQEISAEEGYVGGQIAYAAYETENTVNFGYKKGQNGTVYDKKNLVNKVEVALLAGAYNVGGFIGDETENTTINIYGGNNTTAGRSMNNEVNVTAFENTKTDLEALFNPEGATKQFDKAGTMSNIAGALHGYLYINENFLTVVDNLDGTMKEAVGYKYHNDQGATPNHNIRKFWGDANGYVGYGVTGKYFIGTKNDMSNAEAVGNDFTDDTYGFNVYLADEDYSRVSKNAPEE